MNVKGNKRALTPTALAASAVPRIKIHNRFDIEVRDASTGELKQRAQAENVVLNQYYDSLGSGMAIAYGSGNGTPAATDTALFSQIAAASCSTYASDTEHRNEGYISTTYYIKLDETTAAGKTITEVGLYRGKLLTHAMLMDMNGNQISIKKTSTDIVTIYATLFVYADYSSLGNENYYAILSNLAFMNWCQGYSITAARWGIYLNRHAYCVKGSYSGGLQTPSSVKNPDNSLTINWPFARIAAGFANYDGGATSLDLRYYYAAQLSGDGSYSICLFIPKKTSRITSEAVGTGDGFTKQFQTKFDFPQNAVVYVNGVAQESGVTVIPDTHQTNLLYQCVALADDSKENALFAKDEVYPDSYITSSQAQQIYWYLRHDQVPIEMVTTDKNLEVSVSDDLENWTVIGSGSTSYTVPSEYRRSKYWKYRLTSGSLGEPGTLSGENISGYHIRFNEPPASGAVITIDYDTPMIPKDENHVFDSSVSFTMGFHSEEGA